MSQSTLCRAEAFDFFAEQLSTLEETRSLLRAAVAVSMHALDDVKPDEVEERLVELADRIRGRFTGNEVQATLAHLHQVLFEEEQFCGNHANYYQPINSYIPTVLESRRGLPCTLTLVYKFVAEQVGLEVEGVSAPGHFLARVREADDWMIVDPYFRGEVLSREEAFVRIEQVLSQPIPRTSDLLPTATHAQWLARILTNIESILAREHRRDDLAAMRELHALLLEHQQ